MAEKHTIWNEMKQNWQIKKRDIKAFGIDPDKSWYEITLSELGCLADYLDVLVSDMV